MRNIFIILCICLQTMVFGEKITRTYTVPTDLRTLEFEGLGRLEIRQGDSNAFIFRGEKEILDQFSVKINGADLTVRERHQIEVSKLSEIPDGTLVVNSLNKLSFNGDVVVDIDSLQVKNLMIEAGPNGSPLIEGHISCKNLAISLHGNARAELTGVAEHQTVFVKEPAQYSAPYLEASATMIQLNGNTTALVNAEDELNAVVDGKGRIHYSGSPRLEWDVKRGGIVSPILGSENDYNDLGQRVR